MSIVVRTQTNDLLTESLSTIDFECKICWDRVSKQYVETACGHLYCRECLCYYPMNTCPICYQNIRPYRQTSAFLQRYMRDTEVDKATLSSAVSTSRAWIIEKIPVIDLDHLEMTGLRVVYIDTYLTEYDVEELRQLRPADIIVFQQKKCRTLEFRKYDNVYECQYSQWNDWTTQCKGQRLQTFTPFTGTVQVKEYDRDKRITTILHDSVFNGSLVNINWTSEHQCIVRVQCSGTLDTKFMLTTSSRVIHIPDSMFDRRYIIVNGKNVTRYHWYFNDNNITRRELDVFIQQISSGDEQVYIANNMAWLQHLPKLKPNFNNLDHGPWWLEL